MLAAAAGADLADLEFCQFHPTALALPGTRFDGLLITEAVRGEGATLLDAAGRRFTDELAPRDAVTAAILDRLEADGTAAVKLDLRGLDPARFPNVFASLAEAGLDPRAEPVPVAPAAHYTMGGVAVDLDGPLLAARPLRRRRVLVHGPARRQPARLQLAQRVLRLRRAGRGGGARGNAPPPTARRPPTGASSRPTRGDPRRRLAPRRPGARRRASSSGCCDDPYPLAAAIATCALERARVARRPPARRLPGHRPRARRRSTSCSAPDGETRRETWA